MRYPFAKDKIFGEASRTHGLFFAIFEVSRFLQANGPDFARRPFVAPTADVAEGAYLTPAVLQLRSSRLDVPHSWHVAPLALISRSRQFYVTAALFFYIVMNYLIVQLH